MHTDRVFFRRGGVRPAGRDARRLPAHALAFAAVVLTAAGVALTIANRHAGVTVTGQRSDSPWTQVVPVAGFVLAGWLLATRRPDVVFGWLALAAGVGHGLAIAGIEWAIFSHDGRHLPGAGLALFAAGLGEPVEPVVMATTWAAFPTGRFPPGRIGRAAVASVTLCVAGWAAGLLGPHTIPDATPAFAALRNPAGIDALPDWLGMALFPAGLLLGSVVMILRWRRAHGRERQVLRWLGVVNIGGIVLTPVIVALPAGQVLGSITTVLLLIVVVAVVLANQVYGLDVVLNRALVYTLLVAVVAGVYAAGVGLLALLGLRAGGPWTVAASLGAAFSLAPARSRIQRLINRFLYGNRDEPYAVVSQVASRLEAAGTVEQLLPGLLEAVVEALRLPWVAVEMRGDHEAARRITHGDDAERADTIRFPLIHQGRDLGSLVVARRVGQAELDSRESRLMEHIAGQLAAAASNVLLTEDLILSRERIVSATEEERRRLRRDLHDGLGPVLTAAATKIDAARNLARRDLPRADDLLGGVRRDLTTALDDLRRLVYALRPPALDELGLLGALHEQLRHSSVPVTLSAPDVMPDLPAAVEIAGYRIITEAVTNVTRHAHASHCVVSIECGERLTVEIRDDGTARTAWTAGVGLTSMRERVTALGGSWAAEPTPDGGRVRVELPLSLAGSAVTAPPPIPAQITTATTPIGTA
ncbi:histidine kinase [Frankia sp. AiPs1]|uniref:sensor histidine kinase n=1 Tax=Frankia sp. AiPa1 TaxID=573492 RepID=UPI00202AC4BC|nr:GAF domain-containing sensor histidine kinase [Frankia sp. AiPa1]MCL9758856.1 histidine kinase [Frankia sp. AiPa1]